MADTEGVQGESETKLFHFHGIFKYGGGAGRGFKQTPSLSATDNLIN